MFNEATPFAIYELLERAAKPAVIQPTFGLVTDFLRDEVKPWAYYAGVAAGAAVAAASSPAAALAFYAAGEAVDLLILKSPEGGEVDVFLDGVATSTVQTFAAESIWELIRVDVLDRATRVEVRNKPFDAQKFGGDERNYSWFALAGIPLAVGATQLLPRESYGEGAPWVISFTFTDAARRTSRTTAYLPYYVTLEQAQDWAAEAARRFSNVVEGAITGIHISIPTPAPDGVRVVPEPPSDINAKAALKFKVVQGGKNLGLHTVTLPTFDKLYTTLYLGTQGKRLVDRLADEVGAIEDLFFNDALGNGAIPVDSRGYTLTYGRSSWLFNWKRG